jgi:DNA-binding transcriptional regulator YhcF (GntR family)
MSLEVSAPPALDISVDRNAEIPIGVQLAWALRSRIRDGRFQPGERLPGLREVAEATGVNVNTARTVYQRLEQEGLIDSQQGSGTFVAAVPQQLSTVTAIAAGAAREAHDTGVDPREVAAALYVSPAATRQPLDDEAERRRALRGQIASLERTLGEIEAKHPGVAPARRETRAGIGPTLLDATELERVRTMLVRRLATVQAAIDALGDDSVTAVRGTARAGRTAARAGARGRQAAAQATDGRERKPADRAAEERALQTKPANARTPRARGPMRPAPEGA